MTEDEKFGVKFAMFPAWIQSLNGGKMLEHDDVVALMDKSKTNKSQYRVSPQREKMINALSEISKSVKEEKAMTHSQLKTLAEQVCDRFEDSDYQWQQRAILWMKSKGATPKEAEKVLAIVRAYHEDEDSSSSSGSSSGSRSSLEE